VTLAAVTLFSATLVALSRLPDAPALFILLYAVLGLTGSGNSPLPYAKAISSRFDARRGLALGIAMAGVGLGAAIVPQFAGRLIADGGWRTAYLVLGIGTFVVAGSMVVLFVRDSAGTRSPLPAAAPVAGMRAAEAMRGAAFWQLAAAGFMVAVAVNGTLGNLVPMLTDRGVSTELATSLVGVSGLALIAGRLLSGYFLDRFFGPYVAAIFFLVPLAGILLLAGSVDRPILIIAAVVLGVGIGAEVDMLAFLAGRYFGLRAYGTIYGWLLGLFMFGSGVGPWLMSISVARTGAYTWALGAFAVMLLASAALITRLGPYRYVQAAAGTPIALKSATT
jgi:MFS family permease